MKMNMKMNMKLNRKFRELLREVRQFADTKFISSKDKYGDSWQNCEPEYLYKRMEEEFYEFRQAVEHDQDKMKALQELADLNNFAIMYLIRYLGVDHDEP